MPYTLPPRASACRVTDQRSCRNPNLTASNVPTQANRWFDPDLPKQFLIGYFKWPQRRSGLVKALRCVADCSRGRTVERIVRRNVTRSTHSANSTLSRSQTE